MQVTQTEPPAVLFDIDGTLVDSTYHHALAWQRAFHDSDVTLPFWKIHRTIGMGGDKLVAHVAGDEVEERLGDTLRDVWREEYIKIKPEVRALSGATALNISDYESLPVMQEQNGRVKDEVLRTAAAVSQRLGYQPRGG